MNLPTPLTDSEEFALFCSNAPDAGERLILHTLKEAADLVRKMCRNRFPADEQFSIAGGCLMRAAKTFKPQKEGDRLFTFVKPFLRGAVAQAWRDREPVAYGDTLPEKIDALNPPKPLEDDTVEPDFQSVAFAERWEKVKPLLSRLTEPERRTLTLHYESGFSFVEIAEMQGVSRAAIQQCHAKALLKVRNALMDSGDWKKLTE